MLLRLHQLTFFHGVEGTFVLLIGSDGPSDNMRSSSTVFGALLLFNKTHTFQCFSIFKAARVIHSSTCLQLNRIFCDMDELVESDIGSDNAQSLTLNIDEDDNRCKHIKTILKLNPGDNLKAGVIDIGSTDSARILNITEKNGISICLGAKSDLRSNERPLVDIILAVPRPLRLERILSVISCIGVGNLILIGASKVQNDYFGSHLFRRPEDLKKCLVEGISQSSSDCMLPKVLVRKNFYKFVTEEMDVLFPPGEYHRIVAHPPSDSLDLKPIRIASLPRNKLEILKNENNDNCDSDNSDISAESSEVAVSRPIKKIVVTIGPEGGWEDGEILLLASKGFTLVSLGPRILRTDMAVGVLLGLAHDWTDNIE